MSGSVHARAAPGPAAERAAGDARGRGGGLARCLFLPLIAAAVVTWSLSSGARAETPAGAAETRGDAPGAFVDLDGDGQLDYVDGKGDARKTWINIGGSWIEDGAYQLPAALWVYPDDNDGRGLKRGTLVDVNGDGLPDFVQAYAETARTTWINIGDGWQDAPGYRPPFQTSDETRQWYETVVCYHKPEEKLCDRKKKNYYRVHRDLGDFADLNGDGLLDFVTAYSDGETHVRQAWINTGSGWAEDPVLAPPGSLYLHTTYVETTGRPYGGSTMVLNRSLPATRQIGRLVDLDGDGRADLVQAFDDIRMTWLNTPVGWERSQGFQPPFAIGEGETATYKTTSCKQRRGDSIRCKTREHSYIRGRE
ncbi:MAG: VCBS repeat-containing protein [Kiloniellales bacterium]|nr:VCBS repeat-containing protein [Kiloniellales bacterium]